MFTNVMVTPADLLWNSVKVAVCESAVGFSMTVGGANAKNLAGAAAMSMLFGVTCTKACQQNLFTRCYGYYTLTYIGFAVAALIVCGSLVSLTGAVMPYLGKEKPKDKWSNLYVIFGGCLLTLTGPLLYIGFTMSMYAKMRQTGYYPPMVIGPSFFMAIASALCSGVASYCQYTKAKAADAPKVPAEADAAVAPAAVDPTLVDPTLL